MRKFQLVAASMCVVAALLWAPACGPDPTQGTDGAAKQDAGQLTDGVGSTDKGAPDQGPPTETTQEREAPVATSVETELSKNAAMAGELVTVTCTVKDQYGAPITSETKVTVDPQPQGQVKAAEVVIEQEGTYKVACQLIDGSLTDDTPEELVISGGTPTSIDTELQPAVAMAGQQVKILCKATDQFGNTLPVSAVAQVNPSTDVIQNGDTLTSTKVGSYQVACALGGLVDDTPATLEITPGLPARMDLTADPAKPYYKREETILLERKIFDKYDNEIKSANVKVDVTPDGQEIDKSGYPDSVAFKEDGIYKTKVSIDGKTEGDKPVEQELTLRVDGSGPDIVVTSPKRAEMRTGSKTIAITGKVTDKVSDVTSLKVNGKTITVNAQGEFSTTMTAQWGLNLINVEATDKAGNTGYRAQSYLWSDKYHKYTSPRQAKAMVARLNKNAIDDGNRSTLNDLASILEKVINALDIDSYVPTTLVSGKYKIPPFGPKVSYSVKKTGKITMGRRQIRLTPQTGGVKIWLRVEKVNAPLKGSAAGFLNKSVTVVGDVEMNGELTMGYSNGKATVVVKSISANVDKIKVNAFSGLFSFLNGLVTSALRGSIRKGLENAVKSALPGPAADFLNGFKLNQSFNLPGALNNTTLTLDSGLDTVAFDSAGGILGLAGRITAQKGITDGKLGTPIRTNKQPTWSTTAYDFGVSFSHNFLNELFTRAWYAGALSVDMSDKIKVNGTSKLPIDPKGAKIKLTALLPPLVHPGTNGRPVDLAVGDLLVEITADVAGLGKFDVTAYLSARFGANVGINANNELTFALDFKPSVFAIDVISVKGFSTGDLGEFSKVLQTIAPEISQFITAAVLKNLPLPTIDLSKIGGKYGIPPNTRLGINNGKVDATGDYLKVTGNLK